MSSRILHQWSTTFAPRDWQFPLVVVATIVVAVMTRSVQTGSASVVIAIAVVAVLGIPHGAVDHVVAMKRSPNTGGGRKIDAWYVAAIAAYAVVWVLVPAIAFIGFLALSVHHFGQSDLAALRLPAAVQLPLQWSRGAFLIGLPLVAHASLASPVITQLGGPDITTWTWLFAHQFEWCTALIAQHIGMLLVVAARIGWHQLRRQLIGITALATLFITAEPLIGFAVYFGLWHSLQHINVLQRVLGSPGSPLSAIAFARIAAPRTAISLAGLAVLLIYAAATDRDEAILPLVIVVLSLLTLPHMVIVERLWRTQR